MVCQTELNQTKPNQTKPIIQPNLTELVLGAIDVRLAVKTGPSSLIGK